jgi:hypothetical protein
MNDFKHLVHHDDHGRRIFFKDPPFLDQGLGLVLVRCTAGLDLPVRCLHRGVNEL